MPRILLLLSTRSYRTRAFLRAATKLGATVVVGSERRQALARATPGTTLLVQFREPQRAVEQVAAAAESEPFDAIIGVDDDTTLVAALAAERLGLRHNAPDAVRATRDKALMRRLLAAAGVPSPWFAVASLDDDATALAARAPYPCVLKPVALSASRGVIRADDSAGFVAARNRIDHIVSKPEVAAALGEHARTLLIEGYIPGVEVALEGMLIGGRLHILALFDKPDPLDGPYFEETLYVTPSRLPADTQTEVARMTERAARALGLTEGPVHAELRINDDGAWIVEIAARTIGGLCSDTLEFSGGTSLEQLVLLHATGADVSTFEREPTPAGVLMLPIPRVGYLHAVTGTDDARATPGIVSLTISIPLGERVLPLPEGDRYLGFMFARGGTPAQVEQALREAHGRLGFDIRDEPLPVVVRPPTGRLALRG